MSQNEERLTGLTSQLDQARAAAVEAMARFIDTEALWVAVSIKVAQENGASPDQLIEKLIADGNTHVANVKGICDEAHHAVVEGLDALAGE